MRTRLLRGYKSSTLTNTPRKLPRKYFGKVFWEFIDIVKNILLMLKKLFSDLILLLKDVSVFTDFWRFVPYEPHILSSNICEFETNIKFINLLHVCMKWMVVLWWDKWLNKSFWTGAQITLSSLLVKVAMS